MSRKRISAFLAGAVALGTLSLLPLAGTASAEPAFTPQADDIVGVGSDTSMFAVQALADGYNTGRASARLVSFDAIGSATIVPKQGAAAITRPNGSGAGKATLFGAGNNVSIDFARSSSALSQAEIDAGLFQVPFALDGLKMAVRSAGTNAPATISPADTLKIYLGTVTNWNQVAGGAAGVIVPLIPQAGSGTRTFFLAQMQALNGGVALTPQANWVETQEHSDVDIKDNVNAVAPFSTGRAKTTPTVKVVDGFFAQRALYNVFRQADVSKPFFAPIFGADGFICSAAAKPMIEQAANTGFDQLARSAGGGVCGIPTQAATTNFATSVVTPAPAQATTTALTGSVNGQTVTLSARVTAAGGTPVGTVRFLDGATQVGTANLSGGVGVAQVTKVRAGTHTYRASFTPSNASFLASDSASTTLVVAVAKRISKIKAKVAKRFAVHQRVKAKVRVLIGAKAATGKIVVTLGKKTIARGTLKAGKVTVKLKALKKGKHTLVFHYLGNSTTGTSKLVKKVTVHA
jgi:ABC-type phosphate transport system substrate-binding protein